MNMTIYFFFFNQYVYNIHVLNTNKTNNTSDYDFSFLVISLFFFSEAGRSPKAPNHLLGIPRGILTRDVFDTMRVQREVPVESAEGKVRSLQLALGAPG